MRRGEADVPGEMRCLVAREVWHGKCIPHGVRLSACLTSRVCSCKLRRGFACGGAAMSHTLMLPSPQADTSMFSFSCNSAVALEGN